MPFESGSVSFMICTLPEALPDDALQSFHEKRALALSSVTDEPSMGWVSGRHLLETRIDDETSIAGGYIFMNLRVAVRKIPGSIFKAECKIEELAVQAATNSYFLSRKAKKEIQESVTEKLLETMPPSISGIPFVIDGPHQLLYAGCSSPSQFDKFALYFHETLGFEPMPLNPMTLAKRLIEIDPEDLPMLHFSPEKAPFGEEPTLGRDFCTWLWYFQEMQGGTFRVADKGDFAIMIDGPLSFASEGGGSMETVVRKGMPTLSAEAKTALLVGKKLRQAKFNLVREKDIWAFTLDADNFVFRSLSLPAGEELEPGSHFQERILFLNLFREAFSALYERFLEELTIPARWERLQPAIYEWVNGLQGQ